MERHSDEIVRGIAEDTTAVMLMLPVVVTPACTDATLQKP